MKLETSIINAFLHEKEIYNLPRELTPREARLLARGVPFQKVIGYIQFDRVKIDLSRRVFIPRYETQELIAFAATHIKKHHRVLDLCAGSGIIGLSIKDLTNAKVTLSDISNEAIKQININAQLNGLDVEVVKSNLFANLHGKFDVIISNPPYIKRSDKLPQSVVDFDPSRALWAGTDGNTYYRRILRRAHIFLKPGGIIMFEISSDNAMFLRSKGFSILQDINGKDRIAYWRDKE